MKRPNKSFIALVVFLFLSGCDNPVSYSPFEVNVAKEFRNTTQKNLQRIAALDTTGSPPFKIALISDPHYHYDKLKDALTDINSKSDIAFIIVTGDLTENGLQKEFELFHRFMADSRKPYVTVIGNHDYLSNGGKIYQQMFGPLNYSFTFQNVKFVMWDNVLWESNKVPDWNWFEHSIAAELQGGTGLEKYDHVIPFSHIPPFDGQLSANAESFHQLLRDNKITTSIHGHRHTYSSWELYGDGINYVTVGSPQHRSYAQLAVTLGEIVVDKIEY